MWEIFIYWLFLFVVSYMCKYDGFFRISSSEESCRYFFLKLNQQNNIFLKEHNEIVRLWKHFLKWERILFMKYSQHYLTIIRIKRKTKYFAAWQGEKTLNITIYKLLKKMYEILPGVYKKHFIILNFI